MKRVSVVRSPASIFSQQVKRCFDSEVGGIPIHFGNDSETCVTQKNAIEQLNETEGGGHRLSKETPSLCDMPVVISAYPYLQATHNKKPKKKPRSSVAEIYTSDFT